MLLIFAHTTRTTAQTFIDVAIDQGVDILVNSDEFGNGVSVYDFDEDGWDDVSFAASDDSLVFFRNNEGQLERLPSFLYGPGETKHVLWVDYDNDGDLDLTVTTRYGTYRLYENDGAFNFTDVSVSAGLAQFNEETYGASWGDYDRDGDLDVYFCTYEFEGDDSNYPSLNHLYRNDGDGTFTDVTLTAGVGDSIRLSFQSVWLDYDRDGWQDLFVINDRLFRNTMYRNNGDGTFSDVTEETGTALTEHDPMTASVADFDNDGDLDIYMTNTGTLVKHGMLLVNNDDGTFSELGAEYGVNIPSWSWGAAWADIDNDTWQDLYVTTSKPNSPIEDNVFYHSQAGASFISSPGMFMGNHNARSFGVARGDLDNDGYYELITQNQAPFIPFVWMNSGGSNHYIKVTLQGTVSNRMAIGSWIRAYVDGNCYTQYTLCGENYVGQNSQHHIFGLGEHTTVDSLSVEYVSGHVDTYYDLPVDQHYFFTEGETYQLSIMPLGQTEFCDGNSVVLDAGVHDSYFWSDETTEQYLNVFASGEYSVVVTNEFGIQAFSDTISVTVFPNPAIESVTQNPQCANDSTGIISLFDLNEIPALKVIWGTGQEGVEIDSLSAGIYDYTYIDSNGCVAFGSVELVSPPELFVLATSTPVEFGEDGTINVQVFGGVPPYQVFLNGEPASMMISGLAFGAYDLSVLDAQGCLHEEVVIVDDHTGFSGDNATQFRIYPNPVEERLIIESSIPLSRLIITSAAGQVVFEVGVPVSTTLDISGLSPGHYVLRAEFRNGNAVRRPFIKFGRGE